MKRVKLVPRDDKVYARARVRLQKAEINDDTSVDADGQADALISQKMREKWVPTGEPVREQNLKDIRSNIPGVKRRNKIVRNEYYADPFAYNNVRHPVLAYRLRLLGHSIERIAEVFGVSPTTIQTWRTNFPDFNRAWLEGGEEADAVVAQSLFRKATGWQHKTEKVQILADGTIVRADITEKFAPDTNAAKFWLVNRQGGKRGAWTEKKEVNHTLSTPPQFVINPVTPAQIAAPPTLEAGTFVAVDPVELANTAYDDDEEDDV